MQCVFVVFTLNERSLPISLVTSINPEPLVDISYVSQTDPVSMMNIKVVLSVVMNEFLNVK